MWKSLLALSTYFQKWFNAKHIYTRTLRRIKWMILLATCCCVLISSSSSLKTIKLFSAWRKWVASFYRDIIRLVKDEENHFNGERENYHEIFSWKSLLYFIITPFSKMRWNVNFFNRRTLKKDQREIKMCVKTFKDIKV